MVASIGFSVYSIVSSANSNSFTSFPIQILIISCFSLIAMARTSRTMLKSSGENGHLCLVPGLSRNSFSFSPLRMMLAVDLSYMAFMMLRYVPSMPTFRRVFIINGYWILSKAFSATIEMITWFLFFNFYRLINVIYHS